MRIGTAKIPWFSFARIVVLAALGVALAVWGASRAWHFHNAPMVIPAKPRAASSEAWPPPSTIEIDLSNPTTLPTPSTGSSGAR